jgi:hypothetical protein
MGVKISQVDPNWEPPEGGPNRRPRARSRGGVAGIALLPYRVTAGEGSHQPVPGSSAVKDNRPTKRDDDPARLQETGIKSASSRTFLASLSSEEVLRRFDGSGWWRSR